MVSGGSWWFQYVPIVSSCRENGNAYLQTREHGNKMYEKGGGPAHQRSHTFQVLGVGRIQENPRSSTWFQVVPIVSSCRENGNACQQTREHGNKMYEKGAGPAHQCSHTFQVLGVGHIQENPRSSTWFQVVPIVSTSMENGNACQNSLGWE